MRICGPEFSLKPSLRESIEKYGAAAHGALVVISLKRQNITVLKTGTSKTRSFVEQYFIEVMELFSSLHPRHWSRWPFWVGKEDLPRMKSALTDSVSLNSYSQEWVRCDG